MNNKILKLALLSAFTIGMLTSCERELNEVSYTQIPLDEAMKTESNFTQSINGAYTAIKGSGYFSTDTGNQIIVPDLTTDNLIYNPQGRSSNFSVL